MKKILIIENHKCMSAFISRILPENYTSEIVENAYEALEKLEFEKNGFVLIISNILLKEINGIELAQKIYNEGKEIPFIFISSFGHLLEQAKSKQFPFFKEGFRKPFNVKLFKETVKKVSG